MSSELPQLRHNGVPFLFPFPVDLDIRKHPRTIPVIWITKSRQHLRRHSRRHPIIPRPPAGRRRVFRDVTSPVIADQQVNQLAGHGEEIAQLAVGVGGVVGVPAEHGLVAINVGPQLLQALHGDGGFAVVHEPLVQCGGYGGDGDGPRVAESVEWEGRGDRGDELVEVLDEALGFAGAGGGLLGGRGVEAVGLNDGLEAGGEVAKEADFGLGAELVEDATFVQVEN